MKAFAALLCVVLLSPGAVRAQGVSPAKKAEIEALMETTGALNLAKQMSSLFMSQITNVLKAAKPDLPDTALAIAHEVVSGVIAENIEGLKPGLIEVYDRHFSLEELRGLAAFYKSPLGKKLITVMPSVMQESSEAGRKWGESLGPKIDQRLQERFEKAKIELSSPH